MKYVMHIGFDGLCFKGTQKQKGCKTVQGELEKVLSRIYDRPIDLECCSRLDSDVSAMDFLCAFTPCDDRIKMNKLPSVLSLPFNGILKVKSIEERNDSFSPRFSAHSKTYIYLIDLEGEPFLQSHLYHPNKEIDIEKYKETLNIFLGIHDFKLFSSKDDRKDENETYISAIESIEVIQKDGILFTYIKGPCFHRYQVRFMVGAAVEVATGRSSLESIKDKLSGIGVTGTPRLKVPGKGLVLYKVTY